MLKAVESVGGEDLSASLAAECKSFTQLPAEHTRQLEIDAQIFAHSRTLQLIKIGLIT
jgi:hypothetical protein